MEQKHKWGLFVGAGFLVMLIGSFTAVIPFIGLPVMFLGVAMCVIGIIVIIVLVLKERKTDYKDMNDNIEKEDLRP
ncbi:MAG: hypothetical protein ACMUIE_04615 [Thermoplasmatota archaeon]